MLIFFEKALRINFCGFKFCDSNQYSMTIWEEVMVA